MRSHSRDWGESDYGLYKATDGRTVHPGTVREAVTDLDSALAWHSAQAEPGTFAWLPMLDPLIACATLEQLNRIVETFADAHDAAAILVAVARRLQQRYHENSAAEIARRAVSRTEPSGWSGLIHDAIRRKAWQVLITCLGAPARANATRDLADLVASAQYLPGTLMLELDEILPVIAPNLSPARVWAQVLQYLYAMRVGVSEPAAPLLRAPIRAGWWAPPRATEPASISNYTELGIDRACVTPAPPEPTAVGSALVELLFLHLDHPTWVVRDNAAAAVTWLLRTDGPHAALADTLASRILLSQDDHPVLAPELGAACPSEPVTQHDETPPADRHANPNECTNDTGFGGDSVREMVARTLAAAAASGHCRDETAASLVAASQSDSWIIGGCARRVIPNTAVPMPLRPLPAAYRLILPVSPHNALLKTSNAELKPYSHRAAKLAAAADLPRHAVLHRLRRLTEQAAYHIADGDELDRMAQATSLHGHMLASPALQAARTGFGRLVVELATAGRIDVNDPGLTPLLELIDLDLVRQPFSPIPWWIPVPIVSEWVREEEWLDETTARLATYKADLSSTGRDSLAVDPFVTLTPSLLDGQTVKFGPVAAVVGAHHEFFVTEQGDPTERYHLASAFQQRNNPTPAGSLTIVIPTPSTPDIPMIPVVDWCLSDGTLPATTTELPSTSALIGKPLIISTSSGALHTNSAFWVCLDPDIGAAHGWHAHPTQPLCWQDTDGNLTAATILWRRGANTRSGNHDTVGDGSAVIVTKAALNTLLATAPIAQVHCVKRTYRSRENSAKAHLTELQ